MKAANQTVAMVAGERSDSWKLVPIKDIAEINPKLDKSAIPDKLMVSFVPMQAVGAGDGTIDVSNLRPAIEVKKGFTNFQEGDVLFAKITPCMENGKMAVVPKVASGYGFGSTEYHVLRPKDGVDSRYLYYFVSSQSVRKEAAHNMTGAVGQKRVSTSYIADLEIPLAPPDQQRLIVAEIEKQFSRLDEAVANLKRVKANLKRYKASVLKAAFEGRLVETEAELARREGRAYETGAQLLQRILEARRGQWKSKGKYKEPPDPDTTNLRELPEGWVWASVNQIATKITDGTHHTPEYIPEGVAFISVKDVRDGMIHFDDTKYISPSAHAELTKRCNPEPDDVLITKSGTIGRTAVINTDRPFSLFVSVALIKPVKPVVISKYLRLALDAYIQSIDISQDVKGGLLKNLHLEDMRLIAVPIPPEFEQQRLVAEFDRRLYLVRVSEAQVEVNLKRTERLSQTILKKAYLGKL